MLLHLPYVAAVHRPGRRKGLSRLSPGAGGADFMIEDEENDDLLFTFLKDRELNGDFIARVSDKLWMRKEINIHNFEADDANQLHQPNLDQNTPGFLKLTTTNQWLLGENTAPINNKMQPKELRDDRKRRTRMNLLQYEAVKRELFYLTVGIGSACSVYCLVVFSMQAAVSYATGVLLSCLYLQLLYRYVDNLSREAVPQIFRERKIKTIGIRSGDLADTFEKVVKGCGMALSSPRLVIPAAIYGFWGLSQHFANDYFQLTPAMVGVFAYKAAALVQVYRDNEDLQLIFPGSEEDLWSFYVEEWDCGRLLADFGAFFCSNLSVDVNKSFAVRSSCLYITGNLHVVTINGIYSPTS